MNNQICPFCKKTLTVGYLKTNGEVLSWSEKYKRKSLFNSRWTAEGGDIKLGNFKFFKGGGRVKAYRCDTCKKIIINENDVD